MIAIHNGPGWNKRWIEYCREREIPHKVVNGYASDIIDQLRGCRAFLWRFHHASAADEIVARPVLNAAFEMGLHVFPDISTHWHYDDKVAQKYLFDALEIPTPRAWVFVDESAALKFVNGCDLPVVAKLRSGSSSHNVKLLETRGQAVMYVRRMFSTGYHPSFRLTEDARWKARVISREGYGGWLRRIKKLPRYIRNTRSAKRLHPREVGYSYFQEYIPDNDGDIRIMVVGDKAWGVRRYNRDGDFRASGSGRIDMDPSGIDRRCIETAFKVADALRMQTVGLDFMTNGETPVLIECSYAYGGGEREATGYWDRQLEWHEHTGMPVDHIIELVSLRGRK